MNLCIALFLVYFVEIDAGRKAPNSIRPCTPSDSECLRKTVQSAIPLLSNGIPSLGLEAFDPLIQKQMKVQLPGSLSITLTDGDVKGLKNCLVDNVRMEGYHFDLDLNCNFTIRGKYKAVGQIFAMTLNGDGDAKVKITNIILNIKLNFEDIERDGAVHTIVKSHSVKHYYNDKSKVTFDLTNLFKGDPYISQTMLLFLNEHWRHIVEEFGTPIIDVIVDSVHEIVKKFFHRVPRDELFID